MPAILLLKYLAPLCLASALFGGIYYLGWSDRNASCQVTLKTIGDQSETIAKDAQKAAAAYAAVINETNDHAAKQSNSDNATINDLADRLRRANHRQASAVPDSSSSSRSCIDNAATRRQLIETARRFEQSNIALTACQAYAHSLTTTGAPATLAGH